MRPRVFCAGAALWLCLIGGAVGGAESPLPSDVPPAHWAAHAVREVVGNGVMSLANGHKFQGETRVTRMQAVFSLARLARALEANTWRPAPSVPVPNKVMLSQGPGAWEQQSLTRYAYAALLARFGDYIANGLPRPPANSTDLGKSISLPAKPALTLPRTHPAYADLSYLAANRMISAGSPLLKADNSPVKASEMSRALAEMAYGLNDRLTELGHNPDGSTIDANDRKKLLKKNQGSAP